MKSSAVIAGTAALVSHAPALTASSNVHSGSDETLRIGLVGCGGRGTKAVINALTADPDAKLVSVGDTFRDRADLCLSDLKEHETVGARVLVDADHIFTNFDSYQHVIDACDIVLLVSPPHFRPQHLKYAVDQGKHAFVEKPIAVDASGVREVMESCRVAKEKGLSIVSGLCWRYDHGVRETMRKILEEKMIGDIVAIESSYNSSNTSAI